MHRLVGALLVLGSMLVTASAASATETETTTTTIEISEVLDLPDCLSEPIEVVGLLHVVLHTTSMSSGSYSRVQYQSSHLQGRGLESGGRYAVHVLEVSPETQRSSGVESNMTNQHLRVTRVGAGGDSSDVVIRELVHYTVTGTGTFRVTHELRSRTCA